jgi:DnaJ-class molecular chaperone
LVIQFKQTPHSIFKRFGNDLVLEHQISLIDALNANPIRFKTLEGEEMEMCLDQVITPDTFRIIKFKGMPILNNDPLGPIKRDYGKGNLILRFDVQFPSDLNEDKKQQLTTLLDEIDEANRAIIA